MSWLAPLSGELAGVPLTTVVVVTVGVLVLAARVLRLGQFRMAAPAGTAVATRRPGWLARQRAARGLRHSCGRIAVGCRSALGVVHLTLAELAGHGLAAGGPKSGKTTFLRLLIQALTGRLPIVVI